jgi:hypothetical protein
MEKLTVSEQQTEPNSSESGGWFVPGSSAAQTEPMASAPHAVPGPSDVASHAAGDRRAGETPGLSPANAGPAKPEAAPADALRAPAKVINAATGNRAWEGSGAGQQPGSAPKPSVPGKGRFSAIAAVAVVAAVAGALGSAVVIYGLPRIAGNEIASEQNRAVEASVARIDTAIQALKASVENTSRLSLAQLSKTSERLEKIEKAQTDPSSKIGRLSEALELLRDAPPPIAAAAEARIVSKDATGSITPPPAAAPKPAATVARLPVVDGWLLRRIAGGVAYIEGTDGMFEVHPGDPVPGLGRVDAIRRQDGRWVVVTSRGLVVGR